MSFDRDLLSLMAGTFSHLASSATDGWGKPTVSKTTKSIPCHVTYATKLIRSDTEDVVTSTAQIECPPAGIVVGNVTVPTLTVNDHITLADGVERRILQLTGYTDDTGSWHQSVDLT